MRCPSADSQTECRGPRPHRRDCAPGPGGCQRYSRRILTTHSPPAPTATERTCTTIAVRSLDAQRRAYRNQPIYPPLTSVVAGVG